EVALGDHDHLVIDLNVADGPAGERPVRRRVRQGTRGEFAPRDVTGVPGGVHRAAHHRAASPDMGHYHPHAPSFPNPTGPQPAPAAIAARPGHDDSLR